MKHIRIGRTTVLLFLSVCLCLTACTPHRATKYVTKTFLMMDTVIEIKLQCDTATAQPIFAHCQTIMEQVEHTLSRTLPESLISAFNQTGQATFEGDTATLIVRMLDICAQTEGTFDPTVEPLVTLWNACGEQNRLPSDAELQEALSHVGYQKLLYDQHSKEGIGLLTRDDPQTTLDLGAIGKGYAIDRLLSYLNSTSIPGGILSFGGNIAVFGQKQSGEPYRIGIRDPQNPSGVLGYLTLPAGVVSVSGDYERYVTIGGVNYHHILDPATGYPTDNGLHSVAVICADATLADALSTALFVMGPERAMSFYRTGVYEFEAILTTDSAVILTDGIAESDSFDLTAGGYALTPG